MNDRDFISKLRKGDIVKTRYPDNRQQAKQVKIVEVYYGRKVESGIGAYVNNGHETMFLDSFWIEPNYA